MISLEKVTRALGFLLIICSIVFILIDLQLLMTNWKELSFQSYKMVGSGIPQKNVLLFNVFCWTLLLLGGIGLIRKSIAAWIFPQAFLLLSFCNLINSLVQYFKINEEINLNYFAALVIVLSFSIVVFKFLNMKEVKDYLQFGKYQKTWLWLSVFALNIIGILIHKIV